MRPRAYDRAGALRLLLLLESVGREIRERDEAVRRAEEELAELEGRDRGRSRGADLLIAEVAGHERELRLARAEIGRLGCTLIGLHPPTIRIPGAGECKGYSWIWQLGRGAPRESWREAPEPVERIEAVR